MSTTKISVRDVIGASRVGERLTTLLLYGALWGAVEASFGYGLHVLRRVLPIPGLTGFVLFPMGLLLMLTAVRASGLRWAPLGVAVVAAATKAASVVAPGVTPLFVVNPALAILAEGAVVTAGVSLLAGSGMNLPTGRSALTGPRLLIAALSASFGWRLLFLGLVATVSVQKGILMKGSDALLYFLLAESAVNALLIAAAAAAGMTARNVSGALSRLASPLGAAAVLAVAVGLQALAVPA